VAISGRISARSDGEGEGRAVLAGSDADGVDWGAEEGEDASLIDRSV
jgi:hypothetical protein